MLAEQYDIRVAKVPAAPRRGEHALQPRVQPEITVYPIHPNETQDLETIRNYEIVSGGKTYKIYRGDTHRHTEFSMDGFNDGSLLQAYRYAIDAASLDFYANSEHNYLGGPDVEYHDFLLQQFADCFHLPGSFTPRSPTNAACATPTDTATSSSPSAASARSAFRARSSARRCFPSLPRKSPGASPTRARGDERPLRLPQGERRHRHFAHLGDQHGHRLARQRPAVEPLVEIYQGDRVSAEYEGAPRAAYAGNPRSAPGGFRPAGYVWNAWAKGYKLGVQAASDHVSTHISYACTISENAGREGLLDAMRKRHSYGATDNIVLDYRLRSGGKEYLQGDIVTVSGDFRLSVRVIGTEPIRQIDIVKNRSSP